MKKIISLLTMAILVFSVVPVMAAHIGTGIGVDIETEDFAPMVWSCGDRIVDDDDLQPSLYSDDNLRYRSANYAFEGESISWTVLVLDKNGINKIEDVFATIGDVQGEGNDIEVNCVLDAIGPENLPNEELGGVCGATIGEEDVNSSNFENWDQIAGLYTCTLTVETPDSMDEEYWVTVEAVDLDGLSGTMAENEYWFFNPEIALSIDGDLVFEEVRPGTVTSSETLLIGNDAEDGSGVRLDMFISGSHFYDSSSSGAMCPSTNELNLDAFSYYALNGPHESNNNMEIPAGDQITESRRIMDGVAYSEGNLNYKNLLSPGAEMSITFKLDLPEPCNGDFDTGSIYFWGEAV